MSGKLCKAEPITGPAGAVYGVGLIGADNALCMEGSGGARSYSMTVWQFPHGYAMPGPEWQPYLDLTIAAINTGVELEAAGYDPLAAIEALPALLACLRTGTPAPPPPETAEREGGQRHVHLAQEGTSLCGRCGRDIRDKVHLRWGEPIPLTPADTVESLRAQRDALAEALQGLANALEITPGPRGVLDLVPAALEKAHAALAVAGRR